MPVWTSILLSLAQGAVFAIVASAVARRGLRGPERTANLLFVLWWSMAAAMVVGRAVLEIMQGLWGPELALQVTYLYLVLLMLVVALWALSGYLAFLFTGRPRLWWVLAGCYAAFLVLLYYVVSFANPLDVRAGQWQVEMVFERDLGKIPAVRGLILLLFLPPLLGALAYLFLVFKAPGRMQRFRILLVSGSLVLWFGSTIAAAVLGWNEEPEWIVTGRLIGVAAALGILLAYKPPPWLRRWLGGQA